MSFRNEVEQRRVAVAPFGNEHRTLSPIEAVSFTVTWDQRDAEGKQAGPGRYTAQAHVANVPPTYMGLPGPQAEFALMPQGGALQMTLTPQQTVTDAQTVVTLRSIEFTPGSTTVTAFVAWTAPSLRKTQGMPERASARFTVDDGPAITAENRGYGDEDETGRRLIWELPPVPAEARKVTFVVTQIVRVEGRWAFSGDLGKQ